MWRNSARLLLGFAVFVGSVGFLFSTLIGWKYFWQKQVATAVKPHPVPLIDPTLAKDPSIAGAKLEVVGPLSNAMNGKSEGALLADVGLEGASAQNETAQQPPATGAPAVPASPFDLAPHSDPQAPRHFHATFHVSSYRYFRLLVPAHTRSPRVQGTFKCSDRNRSASATDFLVLDGDQLKDFVQGAGGNGAASNEASGGIIDISLNPTVLDSKEYYLVFSSPDNGSRTVTADLTATFE